MKLNSKKFNFNYKSTFSSLELAPEIEFYEHIVAKLSNHPGLTDHSLEDVVKSLVSEYKAHLNEMDTSNCRPLDIHAISNQLRTEAQK